MTGQSLRIVVAGLAWLVALGVPVAAVAGEAITMPFSCKVKGGKPTLNSAAPTRHEILGVRVPREYRACRDPGGRDCRIMIVHSFDIQCDGIAAPWGGIAAQIRTNDVGTSRIKDGELHLLLKKPGEGPTSRSMARYVMPKGYAPITELGARLIALSGDDSITAVGATAGTTEVPGGNASLPGSGGPIVPRIDNGVVVETAAVGQILPAVLDRAGSEEAEAKEGWQAVVYRSESSSGRDGGGPHAFPLGSAGPLWPVGGINLAMLVFVLAGSSLLAALGWFGRRYGLAMRLKELSGLASGTGTGSLETVSGDLYARMAGAAGGVGAKLRSRWVTFKWRRHKAGKPWQWRNASIANGAQAADALFEKAEMAVRALGPASALRDTLSAELRTVRQRLDGLRGGSGEQPKTARIAASLRSVVRDLERIGRIAESASASVKGVGVDLVMPKTRTEAFEVLGVNAHATEGTLKRIVDALRMGWHPDHAKDEADKLLREERTKQINIAWDLIVGKRAA